MKRIAGVRGHRHKRMPLPEGGGIARFGVDHDGIDTELLNPEVLSRYPKSGGEERDQFEALLGRRPKSVQDVFLNPPGIPPFNRVDRNTV